MLIERRVAKDIPLLNERTRKEAVEFGISIVASRDAI